MALPFLSGRILTKFISSKSNIFRHLLRQNFKCTCVRSYSLPTAPKNTQTVANKDSSNLLEYKIAIVTGGSNGIGFEIARHLLMHGARIVVIADITEDKDNMCCLRKTFGNERVIFQLVDVSKKAQMEKLFESTKAKYYNIDIVVNNAGILSDSEWQKTICINMYGVALGTYLGLVYMGTHNCKGFGGTIINVSSIYGGIIPMHSSPVYSGSKAFVLGLTRSFGHEYYASTSVRVMGLLPGFTVTCLSNPKLVQKKVGYKEFGNAAELYNELYRKPPKQNPEAVGRGVIEMLEQGKHGDLYTVEKCVTERICFPDWKTLKPQGPGSKPKKTPSPLGPCNVFSKPPPVLPPPPLPPGVSSTSSDKLPSPTFKSMSPTSAVSKGQCSKPVCCTRRLKDPCKKGGDCCKKPDSDPCDPCEPKKDPCE